MYILAYIRTLVRARVSIDAGTDCLTRSIIMSRSVALMKWRLVMNTSSRVGMG